MVAKPPVVAWKGRRRVLFRWLCWSCSACLRVFVVVVCVVFVGGLGGIATIGAALRRVVGVSGVYGRKTPRVVAHSAVHLGGMRVEWGVWGVVDYGLGVVASPCGVAGSARVVLGVFQWVRLLPMSEVVWWRGSCSTSLSSCPGGVACLCWWLGGNCYHRRCFAACRRRVGGLWSQNPPGGCSKCSSPRWNAGDMGFLGCSGRRFGRGGCVDGGEVAGGVVAGGMSLVLVWCGSSSLVAWGELLP